MNKNNFLNSLRRKLSILDQQEIDDIINEYEDIIDEKVKAGKTEYEAVSEFGSIDELASEILKTYKLNSKYTKENEPVRETVENIEDGIKQVSHKIGDFFNNLNNGNGISIDLLIELIIKFLIFLVILAILRLPFSVIVNIGKNIFDIAYYPLNRIIEIFWIIGSVFLYIVVGVLIFVMLFKQYANNDKTTVTPVKEEKESSKSETKASTKKKTEKKVVETVNANVQLKKQDSVILNIISGFFKAFMVLAFIIPLWCTMFGLVVALAVIIYYTIVGINIWGLIILFIGLIVGFGWVTSFFHSITFKTKRASAICLLVSLLLTVIGSLAFASNMLSFDYINEPKKFDVKYATYVKDFDIENKSIKFDSYDYYDTIDYEINNDIKDNTISVKVEYPTTLYEIRDVNIIKHFHEDESVNDYYIDVDNDDIQEFTTFKKIYKSIIKDLKKGKIYRYDDSSLVSIKILANEETMKLIISSDLNK